MATPSGTISLNDVNVELGFAGTATISMNDGAVRTLAGVPSGAISMQNLQNKSNRVTASATISADTSNYVLDTAKATGYVAGKTDMTLTINSGVFVSSSSTGSYAFTVNTSWAAGDTVTIVNNGTIIGRGGNGGQNDSGSNNDQPGAVGGPALLVSRAITMNNLNRIAGGGGGGGGGNFQFYSFPEATPSANGGSGGGGIGGSVAGTQVGSGNRGQPGTLTSAGNGGAGIVFYPGGISGAGGNGGTYGSSGSSGGAGSGQSGGTGSPGGAAGACIVGNSNITYINTGTRNGSIS
jgi:hypothetical protein